MRSRVLHIGCTSWSSACISRCRQTSAGGALCRRRFETWALLPLGGRGIRVNMKLGTDDATTPPPCLKSLGQLPSCPTWALHPPSCTEVPCATSSDLMLPRATTPSVPCQRGCFGLLSEDIRRPRFNRKVPIALFSVSLVLFPTTCALSALNRGARRGGSCESHTAVRVPFVSCVPFGDCYAFGDAPQGIGVCIMIRDLISYGT